MELTITNDRGRDINIKEFIVDKIQSIIIVITTIATIASDKFDQMMTQH